MNGKMTGHSGKNGFTLFEVLIVMSIAVLLTVVSGPLVSSLKGAGAVNRAISDVSRSLELARTHAMANTTYVRVVLSEIPTSAARPVPATVVLVLYSTSGASDGDMSDNANWRLLCQPLLIDHLKVFDTALNATSPNTSSDATPGGSNTDGTPFTAFTRTLPAVSSAPLNFSAMIQFNPRGEASVTRDQPARYIKIALDRPLPGQSSQPQNRNPFILRLSGANGTINILRKENM